MKPITVKEFVVKTFHYPITILISGLASIIIRYETIGNQMHVRLLQLCAFVIVFWLILYLAVQLTNKIIRRFHK